MKIKRLYKVGCVKQIRWFSRRHTRAYLFSRALLFFMTKTRKGSTFHNNLNELMNKGAIIMKDSVLQDEEIQKIIKENERALEKFYEMYNKIMNTNVN